jgi:hypothetical protein
VISDHRPICVSIDIAGYNEKYIKKRERQKLKQEQQHVEIDNEQEDKVDEYKAILKAAVAHLLNPEATNTNEESAEILLEIAEAAVNATKEAFPQRKVTGRDGWSPEYVAMRFNLMAVLEIKRCFVGQKHRKQWVGNQLTSIGIKQITESWIQKVRTLGKSSPKKRYSDREVQDLLGEKDPMFWNTLPAACIKNACEDEILRLKSLMHGKERTALRKRINRQTNSNEILRSKGKIGKLIKKMMGTVPPTYPMDTLRIVEEEGKPSYVITDENNIHRKVTEHFVDWHARKPEHSRGFNKVGIDWIRMIEDKTYFMSEYEGSGVPHHLLETIHAALNSPKGQLGETIKERTERIHGSAHNAPNDQETIKERMERILVEVPSYESFRMAVKQHKTKTAGGMSSFTYRMQRAMPEEVLEEMYKQMKNMWEDKHIPEWWKWRWFCPLPKVAVDIGLKDLRPISLVEIMRKTWVSLIINKIRALWDEFEIVNNTQHAYTKKCGTETAILIFINMMEEAKESCT